MILNASLLPVHRRPRQRPAPVPAGELTIAPPPRSGRVGTQGWPLLLPLLSGAGSLPLLLGSPGSGRRWILLGTVASLLLSTGAGLGLRLLARRAAERARKRERARYLDHLQDVARAAERVAALQRAAAEHLHPDVAALAPLVDAADRVWERSPPDEDFLETRLGRGAVGLAAPVRLDLGRDPLADHDPKLLATARDLAVRCARLDGLPVAVSLRRLGVLAVRGHPEAARSLVRSILLRSATFHAPRDLRILAVFPPDAAPAWDWLKWLPHVREDLAAGPLVDLPRCRLAATGGRAAELLESEVAPRRTGPRAATAARPADRMGPPPAGAAHLLVVVDGYAPHGPVGRLPVLDALLRSAPSLDATVICRVDRAADEPSATRLRIELDDQGGAVMTDVTVGGPGIGGIHADRASLAVSGAVARRLAPLWLDDPIDRPAVGLATRTSRLLDVLGIRNPRAIDHTEGWRPRPAFDLLRVPIGHPVSLPGETSSGPPVIPSSSLPVMLDLKEAADGGMGPHGLLIGATGSGKSELLRTVVTALALTHPPELLSFVLVDFKGGAAFAGVAGLPHTAGLITNLQSEPTMVDRARTALLGEQVRRQRLLRDAGDLDSVTGYQRLRADDERLEPLPRLLVVVDEFGELLAAHPEFLDLFTAIGRTGRSLGIHLLLASQRLEEGRLRGLDSHLRYRICLRTFSPAESAAVLGTADAYHLPPSPGHGLLKVDSGPCQPFTGLLVSTPTVQPPATPGRGPAPAMVLPFDPIGRPAPHPLADLAPRRSVAPAGPGGAAARGLPKGTLADPVAPRSDLEAVVSTMAPLAGAGHRTHRVWLPPLAATIPLGEVLGAAGSPSAPPRPGDPAWLRVPLGIVDRPFEQAQEPLLVDFTGRSGHLAIAGAPRSGKSTLLATLVAAFALTHPAGVAQFYCVDLGGGLLHELACLPHVGAVLSAHEPTEIGRLVRELRTVVEAREQAFRGHRIASMAAWHARREADPSLDRDGYGEVFLVVDNWARLRQRLPDLEPEIEALAGTGLHYGVHLVVAANRWADLRLALRDNIGGRLELRLNDPIESETSRTAAARLPARLPGRGLTPEAHEFQVALPLLRPYEPAGGAPAIAVAEIARLAVRGRGLTGAGAPRLRPLPDLVPLGDLRPVARSPAPAGGRVGGVPFALHDHRLEVVRLELASAPHFLVLGDAECGKTATLRCLAQGLMAAHSPDALRLVVVDYRRTLLDLAHHAHCDVHAASPSVAAEAAAQLRRLLDRRLPGGAFRPPEVAGPERWSGPRYVLVVDDYDLVASAAPNLLEPLLDLVAQGRDVGLHVLLARPVSGAARSAFEPFYQRVRETGCPGLIMSGDPREGPLLGGRTATPQPPGRGHFVTRHARSGLIQVAWAPPGAAAPPSLGPP